jgi:hypothetical protein
MEVTKWSNVTVQIQSALATALAITGITKASPGVVSYTGTDPSDGDYVVFGVEGMYQLDDVVARIDNVVGGSDTFEVEGIDTTLFDTFTSGEAQVITFGTTMSTAASVTASGGEFDFQDTTTIHKNRKTQVPGLPNPATFTFDLFWDPADAAHVAMKYASDNQLKRAFKFSFANGKKVVFTGYVGFSGLPTGSAQEPVKCSAVITMEGNPQYYAS